MGENTYCRPQKIGNKYKLPDPHPSPAESNGSPLHFVVNVCFVCRICLGVLREVMGEYAVLYLSKLMHLQCTMSSIFDWEVRRLGMRERVKTRNDNGLRIWIFSQKLPFSVGKKGFKDKFRKYNTLYLYVI